MSTALILYHADCTDGACAAWSARYHCERAGYTCTLLPAPPAQCPDEAFAQTWDLVLAVDMCPPSDAIAKLAQGACVHVLDHHRTNRELVEQVHGIYDETRSGAGLAWDEVPAIVGVPKLPRPWFVDYIEDRDLWRFDLGGSRAINAALSFGARTVERIAEAPPPSARPTRSPKESRSSRCRPRRWPRSSSTPWSRRASPSFARRSSRARSARRSWPHTVGPRASGTRGTPMPGPWRRCPCARAMAWHRCPRWLSASGAAGTATRLARSFHSAGGSASSAGGSTSGCSARAPRCQWLAHRGPLDVLRRRARARGRDPDDARPRGPPVTAPDHDRTCATCRHWGPPIQRTPNYYEHPAWAARWGSCCRTVCGGPGAPMPCLDTHTCGTWSDGSTAIVRRSPERGPRGAA